MKILDVDISEAGYTKGNRVVNDIKFTLHSGEMMGLIGPNGSGKSTTVKAVLGFLNHMEGQINQLGPKKRYSYVPEHPVLYDELTVWEHLELAASVYEIPQDIFRDKAYTLLERFQLSQVVHHLPRLFSKGMQQKVMLIAGFLLEPDLYIVDEPFIGLDPLATKELLLLLEEERERGAAVLLSTHVLDTAEKICDSFFLLYQGYCVAKGDLNELRRHTGQNEASLMDCFYSLTTSREV
ncbi:ABC transporter ATP-binding protein [Melghirimyces algeriensis]|uniref:ABC-2 type transport system ATP-binding protein n=1 Tax=Melghirimyces algeriensis TaxID=910412 RepID=A0A521DKR6_9BACL|nr:ABC transporter ATP-binding protein [Melghirimyces algeriensis]SMO72323.1 ABC-2 type transport system ATP-binding protein [Melghirimyces algeriensis]